MLSEFLPSNVLVQQVDGECAWGTRCDPPPDAPPPPEYQYTEDEVTAMMDKSIVLGSSLVLLAYLPLFMWYAVRKNGITAMRTQNQQYYVAWWFMWVTHYFVFGIPALVWPFTYLGDISVNQFFILANFWFTTLAGGVVAIITTILFLFSALTYDQTGVALQTWVVWLELVLYAALTFGTWYAARAFLVDDAYTYLLLSLPENQRDYDGRDNAPSSSDVTADELPNQTLIIDM